MLYISTTSTWVKGITVSTIHTMEKGVMHTNNKHMRERHYVHQTLSTWEWIFRVSKQVQFFSKSFEESHMLLRGRFMARRFLKTSSLSPLWKTNRSLHPSILKSSMATGLN